MENASHAFLDAVRKSMRQVRVAVGTATVNPKLLTAAERLQYDGYLRREETNSVIRGLVGEGVSIKEIVRKTGHSRKLVRSVVRGQRTDIFRVRQTSLEPHLPRVEAQWDVGLRNGAELWRHLRLAGFDGGLRVVTEWATRRRRAEKAENGLGHAPAARTIVRLMTLERNNLTKAQTMTVAAIEEQLPDLVEARESALGERALGVAPRHIREFFGHNGRVRDLTYPRALAVGSEGASKAIPLAAPAIATSGGWASRAAASEQAGVFPRRWPSRSAS